jgi:hypothetical protein
MSVIKTADQAPPDQRSANTVAEAAPSYAGEKLDDDGLNYEGECPICAAHNYMPNAETIAAIEEGRAMMRGEIPTKWYDSTDEMFADLDRDDPDDMDD